MFRYFCAIASAAAIFASIYCCRSPEIRVGDKEYYIGSASSDCLIVKVSGEEGFYKLSDVEGECASGLGREDVLAEIERLGARPVSCESAAGTVSYYYYSKSIPRYKSIGGKKVNLHIVYDGNTYKMGTPLIFGWY